MRITSTEAQNNFGRYLRMASDLEEVIITRNGQDAAKLVTCREPLAGGDQDRVTEEAVDSFFNGRKRMRYEDFLVMTENSDLRYEFIDGEVYLLASPVYAHQIAVSVLLASLAQWFKGKSCRVLSAPFDVTLRLSEQNINVVQPDLLVICDSDRVNAKGRYEGVPALVVEVLSPSTRKKDMLKKLDLYLHAGICEYWLVDPDEHRITVYHFEKQDISAYQMAGGEELVRSIHFPGFEIPVQDVFT